MADVKTSDIQLDAAAHKILHSYPPLTHDRHRIKVSVENGELTVSGYVKSLPTYNYALNNFKSIPGLRGFNADDFHNDEIIRRDVGREVPVGVLVTVEYGAVILSGQLPEGMDVEALVRKVALVPGVHRVLTTLNT